MISEHGVSERQACGAVNLPRSTYQYRQKEKDDSEIISLLGELVDKHPSIGIWMRYYRIRNMGYEWNPKRVYRVYSGMQLNIHRRGKKRIPTRVKQALIQRERPNQVWSLDFMADNLWNGRRYRILNVWDDYNWEILAIDTDTFIPALRVIRVLEQLKATRGLSELIRVENGPELISQKLDYWC